MTSKPLPRLATARSRPQSGRRFAPGAGSLWARSAAHVSGWNGETDDGWRRQVPALRVGCQDIVELRCGAKRTLEQARLKEMRDKTGKEVVAHFERWTRHPQVRDWINRERTSPEERARPIRERYGLPPEPPTAEVARHAPVKRSQTRSRQVKVNPIGFRPAPGSPSVSLRALRVTRLHSGHFLASCFPYSDADQLSAAHRSRFPACPTA
jgi:hypothetical protein